jgi:hypothetical protein
MTKIYNFKDEIYDLFDSGNIKGYEKLCENLNESIASLEKKNHEQLIELEKLSTTNDNQTLEIHKLEKLLADVFLLARDTQDDKIYNFLTKGIACASDEIKEHKEFLDFEIVNIEGLPSDIIENVSYEVGMKIAEQYKWYEIKIAELKEHINKLSLNLKTKDKNVITK